jgi:DNA modification methylase
MQIINKVTNCPTISWEMIKTWEFNQLKDNSDRDVKKLVQSIKNNGFIAPFDCWKPKEGAPYVLDGTGRNLALLQLETEGYDIPELPVIFIEAKDLKEAKKFALQRSSTHGVITQDSLTSFISDFELEEINLLYESELNIEELNHLMQRNDEIELLDTQEPDQPPEPRRETKITLGDIFQFQIGNNYYRFGCGDSTDLDFVIKVLDGKKLDLLHTDPPYNVAVQNSQGMKIANDNMSQDDFKQFMRDVYSTAYSITKYGGVAYIYHGENERATFTDEFVNAGFKFAQNLIWVKSSSIMSRQDYNWRHEPILYGWKEGAGHYYCQDFTQTTVIDEDRLNLNKLQRQELVNIIQNWKQQTNESVIYEDRTLHNDVHPTMKPLRLCAKLIQNSSQKDELVGDLFLGSGSTLIACIQTKRNCVGTELDPIYCQAIIDRTKQFLEKNDIDYSFQHLNGSLTLQDLTDEL